VDGEAVSTVLQPYPLAFHAVRVQHTVQQSSSQLSTCNNHPMLQAVSDANWQLHSTRVRLLEQPRPFKAPLNFFS
jgi:hypothetical protein